jgi:DNA mismatch repair protein MutS
MNAPLSHPPKTDLKPDAGTTPVMAQYLSVKAGQPDAMLFFRMGDFYELFFEDAQKAAAALGIALTKRGKHQGEDIPMAGVPVHAMDGYLARLIRQGFKVAVCEQLEDPAEAKKRGSKAVVHRDIVRVVTPGTLTEDTLLDARGANRLAAVAIRKGRAGGRGGFGRLRPQRSGRGAGGVPAVGGAGSRPPVLGRDDEGGAGRLGRRGSGHASGPGRAGRGEG